MTPGEQLAYLAGLFDGEGCIYTRRNRDWFQISLSLNQVNPAPIALFHDRFGGTIEHRPSQRAGWRPQACWRAYNARAVEVLRALLPFLVVKADEARVAIELAELQARTVTTRKGIDARAGAKLLAAEDVAARVALNEALRSLKRRSYPSLKVAAG